MVCNKCGNTDLIYDNSYDIENSDDDYYSVYHCSRCDAEYIEIIKEEEE